MHKEELDQICQHINLAHEEWHKSSDCDEWKATFEVREGLDNCREQHIRKPDEEEQKPEGLIPWAIVFASHDKLIPHMPHVWQAKNHASFTEAVLPSTMNTHLPFWIPNSLHLQKSGRICGFRFKISCELHAFVYADFLNSFINNSYDSNGTEWLTPSAHKMMPDSSYTGTTRPFNILILTTCFFSKDSNSNVFTTTPSLASSAR